LLVDFEASLKVMLRNRFSMGNRGIMFWGALAVIILLISFLFLGVYPWASSDPAIDREIAKNRFRAEQEHRGLRRSGKSD
jgi:hypothetical protein